MKKRILTIILSATMLLGAVGLSACTNSELEAKLEELQTQIAEQQSQIEELEQEKEELQASVTEQQAQIEVFEQNTKVNKLIFKKYLSRYKGFCTLYEAYSMGLINKEELLSIAYYNGDQYINTPQSPDDTYPKLMTEDYKPIPKTPEVLSEETELKIKQIKASKDSTAYATYTVEDYTITHYLGTYNECVVVVIKNNLIGGIGDSWDYAIGGLDSPVYIHERGHGYELRVFVKV